MVILYSAAAAVTEYKLYLYIGYYSSIVLQILVLVYETTADASGAALNLARLLYSKSTVELSAKLFLLEEIVFYYGRAAVQLQQCY